MSMAITDGQRSNSTGPLESLQKGEMQGKSRILDLPYDIAAEIFIHCLPGIGRHPSMLDAPLLLMRICKDWRDIALSTPRMWSTLTLLLNDNSFLPGTYLVDLVEAWLLRGGVYPLYLAIRYFCADNGIAAPIPGSFIEILGSHSSRWLEVELDLPYGAFYRFDFHEGLPLLQTLQIGSSHGSLYSTEMETLTAFETAPNLRRAHVTVTCVASDIPLVTLPWAQLTKFTGSSFNTKEGLSVLREAVALNECYFINLMDDLAAVDQPSVVNGAVENLEISGHHGTDISELWKVLTLPGLKRLLLNCGLYEDEPIDDSIFLSFLRRSSLSLRELDIDFRVPWAEPQSFCSLISSTPALSRLRLSCTETLCIIRLFENLLDAEPVLLPHLESLIIFNVVRTSTMSRRLVSPYDGLLEMLRSRGRLEQTDGIAQLKHFVLRWTAGCDSIFQLEPDVLERLSRLKQDGMRIEIGPVNNPSQL